MLAFTKREVRNLECAIGHFRRKAHLYAIGLKAMYSNARYSVRNIWN